MKLAPLLVFAILSVSVVVAFAPAVDARAVCSDAIDGDSCRALVCAPDPRTGNTVCSRDLNPVCVREPCPQPIP